MTLRIEESYSLGISDGEGRATYSIEWASGSCAEDIPFLRIGHGTPNRPLSGPSSSSGLGRSFLAIESTPLGTPRHPPVSNAGHLDESTHLAMLVYG